MLSLMHHTSTVPGNLLYTLKPTKMLQKFLNALLCLFIAFTSTAQLSQSFNSHSGTALNDVKHSLESNCWLFNHFNIDSNSPIEGDGAMISGQSSNPNLTMSVQTPALKISDPLGISFKYRFSNGSGNGHIRWLKIYLTNAANEAVKLLDSLVLENIDHSTIYNYDKTFSNLETGTYKLFIQYGGTGIATKIILDELNISAPMLYTTGCNQPPVAVNDEIKGSANRTATGFMCANDIEPDNETFKPYAVTNSPDGNVIINDDGSFSFLPADGFSGSSTSFTYRICDEGDGSLCSNEATVTILFPSGAMLPASLLDFSGAYNGDGQVQIRWTTTFESNTDRFEIERSVDGVKWKTAGFLKAQGISTIKHHYDFTDHVGKTTANKKDLYYRLKQVDQDGATALSRILIVRVYNTNSVKMISVTPNPAKNDITVTLQLNQRSVAAMKILNMNGSEVQRKTLKAEAGTHSYQLQGTAGLQPGMYLLEVIVNSKERMVVKLVKE
jgi:hypothetical protein